MSTATWSAVGCAVVGAAIGGALPSIGDKIAHGRVPGTNRAGLNRIRRARSAMASVTAAAFMGLFGFQHQDLTLVAWCWLTVTGVCLAWVDIEYLRLPRVLAGVMAGGGLLVFVIVTLVNGRIGSLVTALAAAAATLVAQAVIASAVPGRLGGGDVTLLPALALFLGWCGWTTVVRGLFVGAVFTSVVAVVLVVSGRAGWGSRVAAGPTQILGALVVIAVGVDSGATQ